MSAQEDGVAAAAVETAPVLRVLKGNPSDEELAALVAVLAAVRRPAPADGESDRPSLWTSRALLFGAPLRPAPGTWRASALTR